MNDERRTPKKLFTMLDNIFHFDIDLAASMKNHLVSYFYDKHDDALSLRWDGSTGWCNPPYSRGQLLKWVEHAHAAQGATIVMLLPGDSSTRAGQYVLRHARAIIFLKKRLKFRDDNGVLPKSGAAFASWIAIFGDFSQEQYDALDDLNLGYILIEWIGH